MFSSICLPLYCRNSKGINFIFEFTYDKFEEMIMGRTIWNSYNIVLLLQRMNFQEKIYNICILSAKFPEGSGNL